MLQTDSFIGEAMPNLEFCHHADKQVFQRGCHCVIWRGHRELELLSLQLLHLDSNHNCNLQKPGPLSNPSTLGLSQTQMMLPLGLYKGVSPMERVFPHNSVIARKGQPSPELFLWSFQDGVMLQSDTTMFSSIKSCSSTSC